MDALHSAGKYLGNFVCVVGEFETWSYDVGKDVPTDEYLILEQYNFTPASQKDGQNQIWMNKKYLDLYKANPSAFGCHRVYDSLAQPQELIDGALKSMLESDKT